MCFRGGGGRRRGWRVERTYVGKDGKWSTAANWSPEGVPEAGDTAKFTASATISEDFALPEGVVTIWNTAGTLTLNGVIGGPDSSAPRKLACLSGTATITVLHDKSGTSVLFK